MQPKELRTDEDLALAFQCWNTELFGYVYLRVRQRQEAEDITQEVFLKAWNARTTYRPERSSLKTWMYAITLNTIRDYFRSKKRRTIVELYESIPDDLFVESQYEQKEERDRIASALHTLTHKEQELIILRFIHGLSIKDICSILGKKESAIKVALHRTIQKLRNSCNQNPL